MTITVGYRTRRQITPRQYAAYLKKYKWLQVEKSKRAGNVRKAQLGVIRAQEAYEIKAEKFAELDKKLLVLGILRDIRNDARR